MSEATCPIGGCGYAGQLRSVEAHISASRTGQHRGEVGRSYREQLRETTSDADGDNSPMTSGSKLEGPKLAVLLPVALIVLGSIIIGSVIYDALVKPVPADDEDQADDNEPSPVGQ